MTPDLPEPKPRLLTREQKLERHWRLFVVMLTFIAIYALLHKLLIPFTLGFTVLRETPYSKVDGWFLLPLVLAISVRKNDRNNSMISVLCGMAILYGVYEVYETMIGRNLGWIAFSRLLSSIPLSIACGYLMTQRSLGGDLVSAWTGAFAMVAWLLFSELIVHPVSISSTPSALEKAKELPHAVPPLCGAQELTVLSDRGTASGQLSILTCGLTPSIVQLEEGEVEIINERPVAVNIHLVSTETGKLRTDWNLVVPANSKARTKKIKTSSETMLMLYSDSAQDVGIVAFKNLRQKGTWKLTRKPLSIVRIQ